MLILIMQRAGIKVYAGILAYFISIEIELEVTFLRGYQSRLSPRKANGYQPLIRGLLDLCADRTRRLFPFVKD